MLIKCVLNETLQVQYFHVPNNLSVIIPFDFFFNEWKHWIAFLCLFEETSFVFLKKITAQGITSFLISTWRLNVYWFPQKISFWYFAVSTLIALMNIIWKMKTWSIQVKTEQTECIKISFHYCNKINILQVEISIGEELWN